MLTDDDVKAAINTLCDSLPLDPPFADHLREWLLPGLVGSDASFRRSSHRTAALQAVVERLGGKEVITDPEHFLPA